VIDPFAPEATWATLRLLRVCRDCHRKPHRCAVPLSRNASARCSGSRSSGGAEVNEEQSELSKGNLDVVVVGRDRGGRLTRIWAAAEVVARRDEEDRMDQLPGHGPSAVRVATCPSLHPYLHQLDVDRGRTRASPEADIKILNPARRYEAVRRQGCLAINASENRVQA
jgi:hypothetical protein